MTHWFTSDLHLGHANVIKYSNRPFKDVEEMNSALVDNWNSVVRPGDLVFCLGDFAFCDEDKAIKYAKRLMGNKYLIFGNHDKRLRKNKEFLSQWIWARDLESISVEGQKVVLCHYAMKVWAGSHKNSYQLFGHSHGSLKDDPNSLSLDVGVDNWDYYPASFEEIQKKMKTKTFVPIDHHGARGESGEE